MVDNDPKPGRYIKFCAARIGGALNLSSLARLLGIQTAEQLFLSPLRGSLFVAFNKKLFRYKLLILKPFKYL